MKMVPGKQARKWGLLVLPILAGERPPCPNCGRPIKIDIYCNDEYDTGAVIMSCEQCDQIIHFSGIKIPDHLKT